MHCELLAKIMGWLCAVFTAYSLIFTTTMDHRSLCFGFVCSFLFAYGTRPDPQNPRYDAITFTMLLHILLASLFLSSLSLRLASSLWSRYHKRSGTLCPAHRATVALTREAGSNDQLAALLPGLHCIELPCLQFQPTPEAGQLEAVIAAHDLVLLTSPQAAAVFLQCWLKIGQPAVRIATVGKGTSRALLEAGIVPVFEPSEALGAALARELPTSAGNRLLYAASALAGDGLVEDLQQRGFQVSRLNTYTTVGAIWSSSQLEQAKGVDVVTFASPSAVKAWAGNLHTSQADGGCELPAVVIGPTTAQAAAAVGFRNVHCPESSKGLELWAHLIMRVANGA